MLRIAWFTALGIKEFREAQDATYSSLSCRLLKSAIFSKAVLAHAPKDWDVEVFTSLADYAALAKRAEDSKTTGPRFYNFPVYPHQRSYLQDQQKPFDVFIFQFEDDGDCAFIQSGFGVWPGISYFHDLNLNRLRRAELNHATTGDALDAEMLEEFGVDAPKLGDWQARGWSVEVLDQKYVHGPGKKGGNNRGKKAVESGEITQAALILVQNERSAGEVKNSNPKTPVALTSFPVELEPLELVKKRRERVRGKLNISEIEQVVGFIGKYPIEDRIHKTVEAMLEFNRRKDSQSKVRLLWMLDGPESRELSESIAAKYREANPEIDDILICAEFENDRELKELISACDVLSCLRFDLLRSVSVGLLFSLASGVPCLTSEFGPSAEIPVGVSLPIGLGRDEVAMLVRSLEQLLSNDALRASLQTKGRSYIEEVCDPRLVAEDLSRVFADQKNHLERLLKKRRQDFLREQGRLAANLKDDLCGAEISRSPQSSLSGACPVTKQMVEKAFRDFGWVSPA